MPDIPEIPINREITYLGLTTYRDKNTLFGIKRKDRRQHVYLLGKSGTGKSVLMFNMIIQNIRNGEGVCVVDPHGELVESVLSAIPSNRMKDVIYFNPADTDYHIGFNVLELVDEKYKHLVASGLMGIFTKIWANAWSARMEYILNNTILALLDTPGTTLLGIPRMLVDKDYRQKIINNLKDPVIKAFWIHEYEAWQDKFRNEAIAPIQNKVGQFLSTSIIRNVVGQSQSTINIFDIMNQGKIFLVNVSKGRIGEDNSALLGGMIITKIQLAAMERVRIPEDERKDFYLYVDEFQNFVTDAFAGILSEARKYRLNLTIAHQYTAQLVAEKNSSVRDAVFGNVGTMIVFRVGADDAEFLEAEFEPEFTPQDIVNLPNYKVYMKLMIDGITSRPFSAKTLPPIENRSDPAIEREVIKASRELYCRPRVDVEKEITDWSGMALGDEPIPSSERFKAICSNCGRETMVPFKPEPGRPVYCDDCHAKIKVGEIQPVRLSKKELIEKEATFYEPLAALGIEFSPTGIESPKVPPKKFHRQQKDNVGLKEVLSKAMKEEVKPTPPPISLANLKKNERKETKDARDLSAKAEDMDKLKKVIEEKVPPSTGSTSSQQASSGQAAPPPPYQPEAGQPKAEKTKEVPEDVLRRVLE
ncbi:MAG: CxxC-x17-CxxC domain-containing protein [Patescibacteria group bacterium]